MTIKADQAKVKELTAKELDQIIKSTKKFVDLLPSADLVSAYFEQTNEDHAEQILTEIKRLVELEQKRANFSLTHISTLDFFSVIKTAVYKKDAELNMQIESSPELNDAIERASKLVSSELLREIKVLSGANSISELSQAQIDFYSVVKKHNKVIIEVDGSNLKFAPVFLRDLICTTDQRAVYERDADKNRAKRMIKHTLALLERKALISSDMIAYLKEQKLTLSQIKAIEISRLSRRDDFLNHICDVLNDNMSKFSRDSHLGINVKISKIYYNSADATKAQ